MAEEKEGSAERRELALTLMAAAKDVLEAYPEQNSLTLSTPDPGGLLIVLSRNSWTAVQPHLYLHVDDDGVPR